MDGLFNLPTQPFLYVHRIQVINLDTDEYEQESDERGNPVPVTYDDVPVISGYVALPNPRQAGRTQRMDAVCRVPSSVVVDEDNSLINVLPDQPKGIMPGLVGIYEVYQVRPNPMDIRVLLKRPKNNRLVDPAVQPLEDDPYGD